MSTTIPLGIINFGATSSIVKSIRYFANPKKVSGGVLDGLQVGKASKCKSYEELADCLMEGHHNRDGKCRQARTVVLSVQTESQDPGYLDELDRRLGMAFRDLNKILKVPMLGWIHHNTNTRHLHILLRNSDGLRCLDLRPAWLKQMQGFYWTAHLLTGRGKGKGKALSVYPKSPKLRVKELAVLLVDKEGNISKKWWDRLQESGALRAFRQRSDGSIISFDFLGKRIRLSTLRYMISERQNITHNMITIVDNKTESQEDVVKQAAELGITPEVMAEALADIHEGLACLKARQEKSVATTAIKAIVNPLNTMDLI
ncbi:MAG: hypothetical protein NTX27_22005 [Verrucomicrobia bacterium]|nr:hypothetical protein [Verrucomicrobiota bacterium]